MIDPNVQRKYREISEKYAPQSDASKPRIGFDTIIWLAAYGLYGSDFASPHSTVETDLLVEAHKAFQELIQIDGYENTIVSSLMERARLIRG